MALAMELHRKIVNARRQRRLDIGEGQRFPDRMPEGPAGGDADQAAVMIDRLIAAAVGIGGGDLEIDELDARSACFDLSVAALPTKSFGESTNRSIAPSNM